MKNVASIISAASALEICQLFCETDNTNKQARVMVSVFRSEARGMAAQGNFNKMAFIKKMLNDTPRADAEWIWWTDADTLITDMAFEFPFHRFVRYLAAW